MIGVSISDAVEVERQVRRSIAVHSSLGDYGDFEEDALWDTKLLKTAERVRHVLLLGLNGMSSSSRSAALSASSPFSLAQRSGPLLSTAKVLQRRQKCHARVGD